MARLVNSWKKTIPYTNMDSRAMKAETQRYVEIIRDKQRHEGVGRCTIAELMTRLVNIGKNISLYTYMDSRAMKAETQTQIYTEIIRAIPRCIDV